MIIIKVRLSHVTNSSSSSFVIARKDGCTEKDIKNLVIEKLGEDIKRALQDEWYFEDLSDEIKAAYYNKDYDTAIDLVADEISDILFSSYDLELDNWNVRSEKFSNEDDFYSAIIYNNGYKLISDNFKLY